MRRRVLFDDESEEEGDYIKFKKIRNFVKEEEEDPKEGEEEEEEESVQPVDDEIEEVEEESKYNLEEEGEEKEHVDDGIEEVEEDLKEEEEEHVDDEVEEDLEEEEEEHVDDEVEEVDEENQDNLEEVDDEDLQEEEEGFSNHYYFGKKSPSYSSPNENQLSPLAVDNYTTNIKPKMPTPKPTIPSKRPAENRKNVDVTRSKIRKVLDGNKKEDKNESRKKFAGTCKLWSEDDEITILKGMIDYYSEKGIDPYVDMEEFYKFIIKLLHIDVSKDQLIRKIRRLKKKYQDNMEKVENGMDLVFSKLHEEKSFNLSKKIWGVGDDDDDVDVDDHEVLEKGEASKARDNAGQEKFWSLYPCLNESLLLEQFCKYTLPDFGMSFVKERLSSIGSAKAKEFEDKWRQLHVAETEVKMKRAQLIMEQTKLILNTIK